MNAQDLKPSLFPMEPPFPNMEDGKIRILQGDQEIIGDLIPYYRPSLRLVRCAHRHCRARHSAVTF
jgi:hypothetical protein